MPTRRLALTLASTLMLATAWPALAQTSDDMSFDGMMALARVDRNKDGMVSKKEFLDTMSRVWDERARKAKMQGDKMVADDYERMVLMYLKAGG